MEKLGWPRTMSAIVSPGIAKGGVDESAAAVIRQNRATSLETRIFSKLLPPTDQLTNQNPATAFLRVAFRRWLTPLLDNWLPLRQRRVNRSPEVKLARLSGCIG